MRVVLVVSIEELETIRKSGDLYARIILAAPAINEDGKILPNKKEVAVEVSSNEDLYCLGIIVGMNMLRARLEECS